jgi:hypothetical protein
MERLGVGLPSFQRSLNLPGGSPRSLRPEQYNAMLREFGPIKAGMLQTLVSDPRYQRLSDDQKHEALNNVLREVQRSGTAITKARQLGAMVPPVTLSDYLPRLAQP